MNSKIIESRLWKDLVELSDFGKRAPGSLNHQKSHGYLFDKLGSLADEVWKQEYSVFFRGENIQCANICGIKKAENPQGTLLIGSHFDTRWIADNEKNQNLINSPIPGVNDGGSGVAVIFELARTLESMALQWDILFVLFDAEDLGNIDGLDFSLGAEQYALYGKVKPDLAIILDMVGGQNMRLNIELNSFAFQESILCYQKLFEIGRKNNFSSFYNNQRRMIIGDHYPLIKEKIPALMLIDIDYPYWHTQGDDIDHCDSSSLFQIASVLYEYVTCTL